MTTQAAFSPRTARRTLTLVCLAGSLMTLDITIVNIGLEEIATDFGAELPDLQWVVAAYPLVFAALLLAAGSLSDRVGKRRVFMAGVIVFTLSSIACALAAYPQQLMVARGVQGVGGAMTLAASVPLLAAAYPPERRAGAMGMYSGVSAAAAALGPLVGGALVDGWGWEAIFLVNVVPGALLVVGTLAWIVESRGPAPAGGFDVVGAVSATITLLALNYGVICGASHGWGGAEALGAFAVAAVSLAWFLSVQGLRLNPLLDLRLFRIPAFTGAAVLSFLTRVLNLGVLAYLVLWLQGMLRFSALETGLRLLPLSAASVVTSLLASRVIKRHGIRSTVVAGFVLFAAGFGVLALVDQNTPWAAMLPGLLLMGVAAGLLFAPLIMISVGVAPPEKAGMASGLVNSFFPLGTGLGVTAFGAVLATSVACWMASAPDDVRVAVAAGRFADVPAELAGAAREAFTAGLSTIGLVATGLSVAGAALAALTLPKTLNREAATAPPRDAPTPSSQEVTTPLSREAIAKAAGHHHEPIHGPRPRPAQAPDPTRGIRPRPAQAHNPSRGTRQGPAQAPPFVERGG